MHPITPQHSSMLRGRSMLDLAPNTRISNTSINQRRCPYAVTLRGVSMSMLLMAPILTPPPLVVTSTTGFRGASGALGSLAPHPSINECGRRCKRRLERRHGSCQSTSIGVRPDPPLKQPDARSRHLFPQMPTSWKQRGYETDAVCRN